MTVGSSAGVGYNTSEKYDYELGFAPIPYYSADKKYVIQQGTNIGMLNHNTDEEKLAAWLFIKFLMRPENTAAFAMATGGYLPVKKSAYDTEEYQEYLNDPSDDKKEYSAAARVALFDYIEKEYIFFVDDAFNGSATIRDEAGRIFDSIIVNLEDVQTRFKKAYNSLTPYVPKA
jgi:multiple sugar transport system substrate-binding protein